MRDSEKSTVLKAREKLQEAGYSALLNKYGFRATWSSLRPAFEAYARFNELAPNRPFESFVRELQRPRCHRPDVDFSKDGRLLDEGEHPTKEDIESAVDIKIEDTAMASGVTYWLRDRNDRLKVHWSYKDIPDSGDTFDRSLTIDDFYNRSHTIWNNICGVRFERVEDSRNANLYGFDESLGFGILGIALVAQRNMAADGRLWHKINPRFDHSKQLLTSTLAHEEGHSLGFGHIPGGMMNPSHLPNAHKPQPREIAIFRRAYPVRGDENPDDINYTIWEPKPYPPTGDTPNPPRPSPPADEEPAATITIMEDGKLVAMYRGQRLEV